MDKIVIFLNGPRGIAVVNKLINFGHSISTVVIPTDKKFDLIESKIKKTGLVCLRILDVNSSQSLVHFRSLLPNLFIIAGYSTIFKKELLDIPKKGSINLHAGRLPEYRGGSPLNWQMINGENEAVISIIKVDENIDTGTILSEHPIRIEPKCTIANLHDQVNEIFPELLLEVISNLQRYKNNSRTQNETNARYWHQRSDQDGHLDFSKMTTIEADRFIRALTRPYPGAWAILNQKKIRIFKSEIPKIEIRGTLGRVCFVGRKGPYVICKDKALLINEYLIEGDKDFKLSNGQILN